MFIFPGTLTQQSNATAPPSGLTVESVTPSQYITNVTSHPISMPGTVSAGDLLLAIIGWDGSAPITLPTNWTEKQVAFNVSSAGCTLGFYAKSADGTEGGTTVDFVTSATERMAARVYRVTGWSGSVTNDIVIGSASGSSSNASPNPPSLTSGFGSVSTLWFAVGCVSGTGDMTGYPANYGYAPAAAFKTGQTGTTADAQLSSVHRLLTAASEDPAAFTLSVASPCVANTAAVR